MDERPETNAMGGGKGGREGECEFGLIDYCWYNKLVERLLVMM